MEEKEKRKQNRRKKRAKIAQPCQATGPTSRTLAQPTSTRLSSSSGTASSSAACMPTPARRPEPPRPRQASSARDDDSRGRLTPFPLAWSSSSLSSMHLREIPSDHAERRHEP